MLHLKADLFLRNGDSKFCFSIDIEMVFNYNNPGVEHQLTERRNNG
jgi:hypothetical protein